ncbi:MAG TPA: antibiotic biosynthesis monooxygenase [Acidothermaceae bacterium]
MVTIIVNFNIKADRMDEATACIARFVQRIEQNEPETLTYRSYQDTSNPLHFLHFMEFKDEQAYERHRTSAYLKEFVGILYPCCSESPPTQPWYLNAFKRKD